MADDNVSVKSSDTMLKIGWAETDITPEQPVVIAGQFYARISEGVINPLKATVWVIESGGEHAVFVSCDVVSISDELRDAVRRRLTGQEAGLDPSKVILHATHTHTGPEIRIPSSSTLSVSNSDIDIDLGQDIMPVASYVEFAAERITGAVIRAWNQRAPGGVAFGQGYAVIGRNRRWVDADGKATMYGLDRAVHDRFRHIEGYEDHSVNLLATYDVEENLTGLVVNVPCPSQEGEHQFAISADWWHETRQAIRQKFGSDVFVLPQCSAAGDLSPHLLYDQEAHARMLKLTGRTPFEEIAHRIATAIEEVLPHIRQAIVTSPKLQHLVETVDLKPNLLTEDDARSAEKDAEMWKLKYEMEKQKLAYHPEMRQERRWYRDVTEAYRRMNWYLNVARRFEEQKTRTTLPAELHVLRLGEMAFSTNPFEYYLDFGIQIKTRSPATQTFLVQLAGAGTYVPSPRSVNAGGYGSVPASNPIGPEGGQQFAEYTVSALKSLWSKK